MSIYIFEGIVGCGKTGAITYFLYGDRGEKKTYANYHLKFPYTHLEGLGKFSEWDKEPCNIAIDEAHSAGMDSRNAMSSINRFYSQNMTQSRKIQSDIYLSAQDWGMVDVRVRQITAIVFHPSIVAWDANGKPMVIRLDYTTRPFMLDRFSGYRKRFENTRYISLWDEKENIHILDMYDTSEIIEEMDDPKQAERLKVFKDYAHCTDMTKTGLSAKLVMEAGQSKSDADVIAQYIINQ